MGTTEDGLPAAAERHADGKFHIVGSLIVAPPSLVRKQLDTCVGLAAAVERATVIIIGPTLCYVSGTYCGDPTHVDTFSKDDFEDDILDALEMAEMHRKILTN